MDVDHHTPSKLSYKDKLVSSHPQNISVHFLPSDDHIFPEEENIFNCEEFIPLSVEDKKRLYQPCVKVLIIKVFGRKVRYKYLPYKFFNYVELV